MHRLCDIYKVSGVGVPNYGLTCGPLMRAAQRNLCTGVGEWSAVCVLGRCREEDVGFGRGGSGADLESAIKGGHTTFSYGNISRIIPVQQGGWGQLPPPRMHNFC